MLTAGVAALPVLVQAPIITDVARFDSFDANNDPHGEHDSGRVEVAGHCVLFKIDAYDLDILLQSADPADPTVTTRVLTLMLADEV